MNHQFESPSQISLPFFKVYVVITSPRFRWIFFNLFINISNLENWFLLLPWFLDVLPSTTGSPADTDMFLTFTQYCQVVHRSHSSVIRRDLVIRPELSWRWTLISLPSSHGWYVTSHGFFLAFRIWWRCWRWYWCRKWKVEATKWMQEVGGFADTDSNAEADYAMLISNARLPRFLEREACLLIRSNAEAGGFWCDSLGSWLALRVLIRMRICTCVSPSRQQSDSDVDADAIAWCKLTRRSRRVQILEPMWKRQMRTLFEIRADVKRLDAMRWTRRAS